MIFTPHEIGKGDSCVIPSLSGHDQGSVGQIDSVSWSGCEQVPFGVLESFCPILGLGPGFAVVLGANHHKLGGFANFQSRFGSLSYPLMCSWFSVSPECTDDDFPGGFINEYVGVGASVLVLW